jgi:endonuclease YncB( thermonuclease family)
MKNVLFILVVLGFLCSCDTTFGQAEAEPPVSFKTPGNLYDFGEEKLVVARVVNNAMALVGVEGSDRQFLVRYPTKKMRAGKPLRVDVRYFEFINATAQLGDAGPYETYKPSTKTVIRSKYPGSLQLKDKQRRIRVVDVLSKGEDVVRFRDSVSLVQYEKKVSDLTSTEKRYVRKWEKAPEILAPPVSVGDFVHGVRIKSILTGKAVYVFDGDTVAVLGSDFKQTRIRLQGIDSPESSQPFGENAKVALAAMIKGQEVRVLAGDTDQFGRTLGFIELPRTAQRTKSINANAEMVRAGWAWHYKGFNDSEELAKLELDARAANRGLWAGRGRYDQVPPWDYRRVEKEKELKAGR